MRNKTHIGLVNAHTKGNGGDHHQTFFTQKAVLVVLSRCLHQSCVVRQSSNACIAQQLRNLFYPFARLAIHNAAVLAVRACVFALNKAQQLRRRIFFLDDGVADVGPVETADELLCVF